MQKRLAQVTSDRKTVFVTLTEEEFRECGRVILQHGCDCHTIYLNEGGEDCDRQGIAICD